MSTPPVVIIIGPHSREFATIEDAKAFLATDEAKEMASSGDQDQ